MVGEELKASEVTLHGLLGDRAYTLLDAERAKIASAKNPKKWAKLPDFRATFTHPPHPHEAVPPVTIVLPDENSITTETPAANNVWLEKAA